jgi:hypothetical protein
MELFRGEVPELPIQHLSTRDLLLRVVQQFWQFVDLLDLRSKELRRRFGRVARVYLHFRREAEEAHCVQHFKESGHRYARFIEKELDFDLEARCEIGRLLVN